MAHAQSVPSTAIPSTQVVARIRQLPGFWTRQFAFYLQEHRHPLNRTTHMVGIPLLIITGVWGLLALDWRIFLGGQVVGWVIQVIGHRIEGNRPALLKNPISFLMGPLMVLVEIAELTGLRFGFAQRARAVVFPTT